MADSIVLASGSATRSRMLLAAGIPHLAVPPRIDEDAIKSALIAEGAKPGDIADSLAEFKARKVSEKHPEAYVLGADQVLDFEGATFSKPASVDEVREQLLRLRGKPHKLLSAAVIYKGSEPQWRTIGTVRLTMRPFSDSYLSGYLARHGETVQDSVGGYRLEEEGIRLFDKIDGDYFTILGLPLLDVIRFLTMRGVLEE